jgi:hypothetical protein
MSPYGDYSPSNTTVNWTPDTYLPNYIWWTTGSTVPHQQKCPNCGYCACCGRADEPATPE